MHIFEFIVVVLILAGVLEFLKQRKKLNAAEHTSSEQQTFRQELADLKDRVVVLEKIITDKGYDLKSEIDDL